MAYSSPCRVSSPFAEVEIPTDLVYEQGAVSQKVTISHSGGKKSKHVLLVPGKLSITQNPRVKFIEWAADTNQDEEKVTDYNLSKGLVDGVGYRASHNDSGLITFAEPCPDEAKVTKNFKIDLEEIRSLTISQPKGEPEELLIYLADGSLLNPLVFMRGGPINIVSALRRFILLEQHHRIKNSYVVKSRRESFHQSPPSITDLLPEQARNALGYVNDFTKDPKAFSTTMLSKVGGVVVTAAQNYIQSHMDQSPTHFPEPPPSFADNSQSRESDADYTTNDEGYEVVFKPDKYIELTPRPATYRGQQLSQEQWLNYMTNEGRINNFEEIKKIIFQGGIHPDIKKAVWPFILGLYDPKSTYAEREELFLQKRQDYLRIKNQWLSITPDQEERFHAFRDFKSLVDKDVTRTDRSLDYFKGDTSEGTETLRNILMTYVMYHFNLGYVQGMSDILAPILMEVQDEVMAFWLFVQFMDRINSNFEMSQEGMKRQLSDMYAILQVVDPRFSAYLDACDASNMFFAFRWMLILFKREFSTVDTLTLWEVLWTQLPGPNFPLIFGVAILELHRNTIIENKYGLSEILRHLNDLSLRIDLDESLKEAEAIYMQLLNNEEKLPVQVLKVLGLPIPESNGVSANHSVLSEGFHEVTAPSCTSEGSSGLTCSGIQLEQDEQLERQYETSLLHQLL